MENQGQNRNKIGINNVSLGILAGIVIGTICEHSPSPVFTLYATPAIAALSLVYSYFSDPSERMASERVGDMLKNLGAIGLGAAGSIAVSYLF